MESVVKLQPLDSLSFPKNEASFDSAEESGRCIGYSPGASAATLLFGETLFLGAGSAATPASCGEEENREELLREREKERESLTAGKEKSATGATVMNQWHFPVFFYPDLPGRVACSVCFLYTQVLFKSAETHVNIAIQIHAFISAYYER